MTLGVEELRVLRRHRCVLDIPALVFDHRPTLLLGANGAGKSTLLSVLSHRLRPSAGHVAGEHRAFLVEQSFRPIVGFTALEYCAYVAWLFGRGRRQARTESPRWMDFVDLRAKSEQRCETLSGGEKARLAIATALNSGARMLLLDEPSAALDPVSKQRISEIYAQITARGIALVVSTHDASELQAPFARVVVLDGGRVHFDGTREGFWALSRSAGNSPEEVLARSFAGRRPVGDV